MKLSEVLKSVFTSGESYTVLQLLNKMIKAVEDYESENWQHTLTLKFNGGGGSPGTEVNLTIKNNSEDDLSKEDLYKFIKGTQIIRFISAETGIIYCYDTTASTVILSISRIGIGASTYYLDSIISQTATKIE